MTSYIPHHVVWRASSSGVSEPMLAPTPMHAPPLRGQLVLDIQRGKNMARTTKFGNQHLYVEAKVRAGNGGDKSSKEKSNKKKSASRQHTEIVSDVAEGPDVEWNERLVLPLTGVETVLRLKVIHRGMFGKNNVGTARLPLDHLLPLHGRSGSGVTLPPPPNSGSASHNECWVDLVRSGGSSPTGQQYAGSLLIAVHFDTGLMERAQMDASGIHIAAAEQNLMPTRRNEQIMSDEDDSDEDEEGEEQKSMDDGAVAPAADSSPRSPSPSPSPVAASSSSDQRRIRMHVPGDSPRTATQPRR